MKDFLGSIFKTTEERLKNPFVGSFIISFIAFNWKPILIVIFSNIPIEDRVSYVSNNYSDVAYLLVLPLLLSLFYVLFLPKIMCWIDENTFESFKKRNKHLYSSKEIDIQGQISIAEKEVELENKKAESKDKADLNAEIKNLKNTISSKDLEIENLKSISEDINKVNLESSKKDKTIKELENKINVIKEKEEIYLFDYERIPDSILESFVDNLRLINKENLKNSLKESIIDYIDHDLVEINNDKYGQQFLKITDKGLFVLKQSNIDGLF
ncbi:hypothetical protein ACKUSY_05600 [Myroides odoratus]